MIYLTSFQRERTSFLLNSTHMQGNEKNYLFEKKIEGVSILIEMTP